MEVCLLTVACVSHAGEEVPGVNFVLGTLKANTFRHLRPLVDRRLSRVVNSEAGSLEKHALEPLTDVFLASPGGSEYSDADPLSLLRPCQSGGVLRIWARLKPPHSLGLDSAAVYGSFLRRKGCQLGMGGLSDTAQDAMPLAQQQQQPQQPQQQQQNPHQPQQPQQPQQRQQQSPAVPKPQPAGPSTPAAAVALAATPLQPATPAPLAPRPAAVAPASRPAATPVSLHKSRSLPVPLAHQLVHTLSVPALRTQPPVQPPHAMPAQLLDDEAELGRVLCRAVTVGDVAAVQQLLRLGGGSAASWKDETGDTPVVLAAHSGRAGVVKALLAAGGCPDTAGRGGLSPLAHAACKGHVEVVRALLAAGANPNQANQQGWNALHFAAKHGQADVIAALAACADVGRRTARGATALHIAAGFGRQRAVQTLLAAGADVGVTESGWTALHVVVGCWEEERAHEYLAVARILLTNGVNPLASDTDGTTALGLASKRRDAKLLHALIDQAVDSLCSKSSDDELEDLGRREGSPAAASSVIDQAANGPTAEESWDNLCTNRGWFWLPPPHLPLEEEHIQRAEERGVSGEVLRRLQREKLQQLASESPWAAQQRVSAPPPAALSGSSAGEREEEQPPSPPPPQQQLLQPRSSQRLEQAQPLQPQLQPRLQLPAAASLPPQRAVLMSPLPLVAKPHAAAEPSMRSVPRHVEAGCCSAAGPPSCCSAAALPGCCPAVCQEGCAACSPACCAACCAERVCCGVVPLDRDCCAQWLCPQPSDSCLCCSLKLANWQLCGLCSLCALLSGLLAHAMRLPRQGAPEGKGMLSGARSYAAPTAAPTQLSMRRHNSRPYS